MIFYKSSSEIQKMRQSGRIVAEVLDYVSSKVRVGMCTFDLEELSLEYLSKYNGKAKAAFKGYMGFPCALCVSINNEVVHGIPSKNRIINDGDIISMDFGVIYDGYYGDAAKSIIAGAHTDEEKQKLLDITKESLYIGIENARIGNHLHDISASIQNFVEKHGFSVVRDFVGHGLGRNLHESPQVPNYGEFGKGVKIQEGLTIAIEPMVNAGAFGVSVLADGWTAVTTDGSLSAHFEHSIAVTKDGAYILTEL